MIALGKNSPLFSMWIRFFGTHFYQLSLAIGQCSRRSNISHLRISSFMSVLVSISAATNSETGEEVAIKKIGNAFDNIIDAKRTLREIKLLKHMDHENVGT